ncbi:DUF6551 family protein [Tsuneonella sp. HG222]
MARAATSRLKVNPPLGRMPVLQFMQPSELSVDASYQRSTEGRASEALIRRIAQYWNWDLCLPLVVSRRPDGALMVIDGQHRLQAARLRSDISQLPCMVKEYASAADEAASFVHLNQERKPLSGLDLFKAALASEDPTASAVMAAIAAAGLSLAPHENYASWKPGMVSNIGGIQNAWRKQGERVTREALQALGTAFAGEVLRYAGTIFPGLVAVCTEECRSGEFDAGRFARFTAKLGARGQDRLRRDIVALCAARPDLGRTAAAIKVVTVLHWPERAAARAPVPNPITPATTRAPVARTSLDKSRFTRKASEDASAPVTAWCDQCEMRVTLGQAEGCKSRFCSLRPSKGRVAEPA